ncbi:MAG TPA: heavy metal sensor histidine kinase [Blastocatellia bacterium]|nr:heavy metal sensor histidine kinase [Blastocatellia bacterium]
MNTRSIRFRLTAWYAGLLAGSLLLFGVLTYMALGHYLALMLDESLTKQAQQISETLITNINESGDAYVIDEIKEHFAPEINGRFIRVTRADGSLLYVSGLPKDGSFDPASIPVSLAPPGQEFSREERLPQGKGMIIHALPYASRDGARFLIEVGALDQQIGSVLHGLMLALVLVLPIAVAVAIGGGYWLMKRALRPVDQITQSAERITSRNLGERLPAPATGDELERLSISLNGMIARLEESFQHVSRFSADASHELRTPLTILHGELEAIVQRRHLDTDVREAIGSALEETERLAKIVESLLAISRLDAGEVKMERERLDLADLAATTTEQMRLLAEDKRITLRCDTSRRVEVEGNPSRLKQVVVNLLDNAIKYTPTAGTVQVRVGAANGNALLEIEDDGVGIPAEALPHLFERFYRVDKARSRQMGGTGLGLSIVKSICAAHGGQVKVESAEGKGSRFRVELPLANGTHKPVE